MAINKTFDHLKYRLRQGDPKRVITKLGKGRTSYQFEVQLTKEAVYTAVPLNV